MFSNIKEFQGNGTHSVAVHGKDSDLVVKFYREKEVFYKDTNPKEQDSEVIPVHVDTEFCEMRFPGNPHYVAVQRVTNEHKRRFPQQYEAFKRGENLKQEGHTLESTGFFSNQQIRDFNAKYIFTVEQFISMPELFLQGVLGGLSIKKKCQEFLEAQKTRSLIDQGETVEELKKRIQILESSLAAEPRKVGRPPKANESESKEKES